MLQNLDNEIRIISGEEHDFMNKTLADFAQNPFLYDLYDLMDDEEIKEMAEQFEELRKELYENIAGNCRH